VNQLAERKGNSEGLRCSSVAEQNEDKRRASEALAKVAAKHSTESVIAIALAYILCKAPYIFPIISSRKVEYLQDNIKVLLIRLIDKQIEFLKPVKTFDLGFPTGIIGEDPKTTDSKAAPAILTAGHLDFVISPRPIYYQSPK
jgi:hypothetical protein